MKKKDYLHLVKRGTAAALIAAMVASGLGSMPVREVEAARVDGDAPFINTWLVAGPAENSIYGESSGEEGVERPYDGNWARLATATANSQWNCGWHLHEGKNVLEKGLTFFWVTDATDGVASKEVTITWDYDVPVKTIALYAAEPMDPAYYQGKMVTPDKVQVTLYGENDEVLDTFDITEVPEGEEPVEKKLEEEIPNVRKIVLAPTYEGGTDKNMAIGTVAVYDAKHDEVDTGTPPEGAGILTGVTASANNVCNVGGCNAADGAISNAMDGDPATAWKSKTHQGVEYVPGVMTLTMEKVSLLTEIDITGYEDSGKNKFDVVYTLLNSRKQILKKNSVTCTGAQDDQQKVSLGAGVADVKYIILEFESIGLTNHLGIREVALYGIPSENEGEEVRDINVTPVLGEEFNGSNWQYFDDRIYNRNTDDYNDLQGYFETKQGLDTTDKFVYAHTYVYSEKEQTVQLRYSASGAFKVFVNDIYVGGRDVDQMLGVNQLYKDVDKVDVTLKEGWNKVLFEIQHIKGVELKGSPWGTAHCVKTAYMGLYARISDTDGNAVDGITYSVAGDNAQKGELEIVTRGLEIDKEAFEERNADIEANEYPDNELPIGYTEWPYVWNEAVYRSDNWAPQAGKFQFQAAGGVPGYTWTLEAGTLPPGLTLNTDGTVDGYCAEETGVYPFTVKVTDSEGNTATKATQIIVKERPNKWLEEAGADALTHCSDSYAWYYDENFSYDLWAERAKNQGLSLVYMEAQQQWGYYYWPFESIDPKFDVSNREPECLEVVDGKLQVKDGLMPFKEAAERHGLKFGLYYGFFYNWQEIVPDLMERYNPSYFFFDGNPQNYDNADIVWSMVRSYNDDILIQSNDQKENGDNDMTILEQRYYFDTPYLYGGYWEANMLQQNKYTVEEVWGGPYTKDWHGENAQTGLDWRLACKAFVTDIGHGYVRNWDQSVGAPRNRLSNTEMNQSVKFAYDSAKLRQQIADWFSQPGEPDKRETLFGVMPYTFDYEKQAGWHDDPELAIKYGEGPEWGYVLSRDNNFYMHMVEVKIPRNELTVQYDLRKEKTGFTGQDSMEAGPFDYEVTSVEWFNEGKDLPFDSFEKNGKYYVTIDTSAVEADPVDTIIKIQTADPGREYEMTGVKAYSSRIDDTTLQLTTECTMNNLATILVTPESLTFASSDPSVATVDQNGIVKAGTAGTAIITVTAAHEGVTISDTYPVKVDESGFIREDLELCGVVLTADDSEILGMYNTYETGKMDIQGRTEKGGGIDLNYLDESAVTYHYSVAENDDASLQKEVTAEESIFFVENGVLSFKEHVEELTRLAVWAEVQVDGKTYTTNKVHIWAYPSSVLNEGITPEASSGTGEEYTTDGKVFKEDGEDTDKWAPEAEDKNPSLMYDLGNVCKLDGVEIAYNGRFWRYVNAPDKVQIEVSEDGEVWRTVIDNVEAPRNDTNYHFEDYKIYSFDDEARYVRISFPGGAQEDSLDIMEIRIKGIDYADSLSSMDITPVIGADGTTATVNLEAYNGLGEAVDLSDAVITMTSDNPEIADVNDSQVITAKNPGQARIWIQVRKGAEVLRDYIYLTVEDNGKFLYKDFLKNVELRLSNSAIDTENPITPKVIGTLNTGKRADLTNAEIEYGFSDERLSLKDGRIALAEEPEAGFRATVTVTVTLDGITLTSQEVDIVAAGDNIARTSEVTVSSVYPVGDFKGENLVDGKTDTAWASAQQNGANRAQWFSLDFGGNYEITEIKFLDRGHAVNEIGEVLLEWDSGELLLTGMNAVDGTPTWHEFKLDEPIVADEIRFTVDPDSKYFQETNARGFMEVEVYGIPCDPEEAVNTETLEKLVAEAMGMDLSLYTDETVEELKAALKSAEEVLNDETAKQEDIDAAEKALQDAINGLEEKVYKALLQKTYEYALTLSTEDATDAARDVFEKAMAQAKAALENPEATQEEVNGAWDDLLEGIWGLGVVKGDLTYLKMLIDKADSMLPNEDKYVADNWQKLLDELAEAEEVYNNENALQPDIDTAAEELLNAILIQRYKADKSNLEELIRKAESMDLSIYTKESVAVLEKALAEVKAVLADESLSVDDQNQVDLAAKELNDAIKQLVKASSDGGNQGGTGSDNNSNTGNGDNNNNGGSSDSGKDDGKGNNTGKDAPRTGDNFNILLWLAAALATAGAGAAIVRKRKTLK